MGERERERGGGGGGGGGRGGREGGREGGTEGGREGGREGGMEGREGSWRERVGEMASMSTHNMRKVCKGERQRLCCMYRYLVPCRAECCSSSGPTLASILRYLMSMACSDPPQATAATVLLQWNL